MTHDVDNTRRIALQGAAGLGALALLPGARAQAAYDWKRYANMANDGLNALSSVDDSKFSDCKVEISATAGQCECKASYGAVFTSHEFSGKGIYRVEVVLKDGRLMIHRFESHSQESKVETRQP